MQDIVDQIQFKISSQGGIAEGVQVPTLRTSSALTPSTGQGPQKRAKPQVATNPKFPKYPNVPIGAPHLRNPATYEITGLLPAKTGTDRNGPANAQAPAMIQLLRRSNPEFTISYGFCIEMCGMLIFVAIG